MSKTNDKCLQAFENKQEFKSPSCSVEINCIVEVSQTGLLDATHSALYSYDLLIGINRNNQISLLPYPPPKTPKLKGGSKTSRSLIKAAWLEFPNANVLKQ